MTKKILLGLSTARSRDLSLFLSDGPWRGFPSACKNVLTTTWRPHQISSPGSVVLPWMAAGESSRLTKNRERTSWDTEGQLRGAKLPAVSGVPDVEVITWDANPLAEQE